MHRIPIVQQAGDSHPGLTARAFRRWTREYYLNFPEAGAVIGGEASKLIDTGAPIEPPPAPRPDRAAARRAWGFPAQGGHVLLIYGGSQGSRAINVVVAEWVKRGLPDDLHLIWMTGRASYAEFASLDGERVRVREYLSPIADAYAAADLALARAGAMTTAELFAWRIPGVLVPLPTAAADHQTANARTLEAAGAAINLPQAELTADRLDTTIRSLLSDPAAMTRLAEGAAARARPRRGRDDRATDPRPARLVAPLTISRERRARVDAGATTCVSAAAPCRRTARVHCRTAPAMPAPAWRRVGH